MRGSNYASDDDNIDVFVLSSKLQSDGCYYQSVVAPSGECLPGECRYGVFAV